MMRLLISLFYLLASVNTWSQYDSSTGFAVTKPAGNQYKASGWKMLWWGKHYRKEWGTPVQFPVLDFSSIDGGLEPVESGGGHETKTLKLVSRNGRSYVLRSIDKSLDVLVPGDFKGTFVNDLVNDQICTAHPYGPLAIAQLAGTLNLPHTNPVIYYVSDNPALGDFRPVFSNRLCMLEERPSGNGWEHSALFANANVIDNTEKMLNRVFNSSGYSVDQAAFLKVRLFDMLVNDWDRHEDQWVWALNKAGAKHIYTPIGRDRDQAFSKTDGLALWLLSRPWALRSLQDMNPTIRDIRGTALSARNLDRQFLNELSKDEWQRTIDYIRANLPDPAIRSAVEAMPLATNNISGDFLTKRLQQRRDHLGQYSMHYYSILSKQITINGSADNELFIVDFKESNTVIVTGLTQVNDTFYHRVFNRHETKEINIYGLSGDDQYIVTGKEHNNFRIRFVGGEGNNTYKAEEEKKNGRCVRVYDSIYPTGLAKVFKAIRRWDTLYNYKRASVTYDWYIPLIIPGYNADDGFNIAIGLVYRKQKWGKAPFGWQQKLSIDYASGTGAVGFGYKGVFRSAFSKWDFDLQAFYKGPRFTLNYYGPGNETEVNGQERSYFKVKADNLYISPAISRSWKYHYLRFGTQYERVKIRTSQEDKFIVSPQSKVDSGIFSTIPFAGINGEWSYLNAGNMKFPENGFHLTAHFSYLHNLDNTDRNNLRLTGSLTFYHTFFNSLTFAHRTGASTIFGDYEFYQAATLGGNENLRGYWRNRFAGKSNFFQNTELRLSLFNLRGYVVRGKLGIFGFIDDGRVWIAHENSSKFHTGCGGGIFLLPYNLISMNLFYAKSEEKSLVTLRAGFFF